MNEEEGKTGFNRLVSKVEQVPKYLDRSLEIFNMSRHFWHNVLGRDFINETGFKVANLGAGEAVEGLPFAYALEGKSGDALKRALLRAPKIIRTKGRSRLVGPDNPKVEVFSFDYDTENAQKLRTNFFLRGFTEKGKFVQANFTALPAGNEVFDICLIRNPYWDELEKTDEVNKAFAEFDRVLKPKGLLWMTFLSEEEFNIALGQIKLSPTYQIKFFGESGFQIVKDIMPSTGEPVPWDKFIILAEKG